MLDTVDTVVMADMAADMADMEGKFPITLHFIVYLDINYISHKMSAMSYFAHFMRSLDKGLFIAKHNVSEKKSAFAQKEF